MLWPSSSSLDNDNSNNNSSPENNKATPSNKRGRKNKNKKSITIRDRLKLFHKHDDDSAAAATAAQTGQLYDYSSLSPTKYLNIMFHYLQNNIQIMSEYLYSSNNPSSSSQQQQSNSASASAYTLFRHAQYKAMIAEPKDTWEGLLSAFSALRTGYVGGVHSIIDGAYELGYGTISACIALFQGRGLGSTASGNGNDGGPLSYAFITELAYGLQRGANHAADGLYLFAAGAVVGTRNLIVGISRTPRAMHASQLGMMYYPSGKRQIAHHGNDGVSNSNNGGVAVWDYYSLDYEDREIRMEEDRLKEQDSMEYPSSQNNERKRETTTTRNIRRRRASVSVKDKLYYDVLGVATDANPKEIRSAYRKEALKRHPDKQQTASSSPPTNIDAMSEADPHIEGFLDLTQAYRILSNDASRDAYDQHGLCFREEATLPEEGSHEDYVDLIDELFGASAVRDYVGNVLIAPIVNEMFGFTDNHGTSRESVEIQNLQQRRRIVDVALYLRARVNSYARGETTMEEFTLSCRKEANFILQGGGEPTAAFLRVIGKTLLEDADQHIGYVLPFVRKTFSDSSQKVKSSIANARVYAPIYFRAALEGLVLGSFNDRESDDPGDCSGGRQSNKEPVDQDAVLNLLWNYVVADTVATLRGACEKVFADRGASDASLAFVKAPSLIKYQRAEAIRILANEMLAAIAELAR